MPTTIVGERSLFETVGSSVEIGNYKTSQPVGATVNFNDTSLAKYTGKAYFSSGTIYGDFAGAQSTKKGDVASGSATYKTTSDEVVYTMKFTTTSEPIDTHPDFEKIGGNGENPRNAAVFETDGSFRKFAHKLSDQDIVWGDARNAKGGIGVAGDQNWYAGVSSYLEASGVWTKSFKSDRLPTLDGLGRISTPDGEPPEVDGRNWLYTGFSATFTSPAKGDVNRKIKGDISMEWMMSGRRGWDKDIYGESAPEGGEDAPLRIKADFNGNINENANANQQFLGPVIN